MCFDNLRQASTSNRNVGETRRAAVGHGLELREDSGCLRERGCASEPKRPWRRRRSRRRV